MMKQLFRNPWFHIIFYLLLVFLMYLSVRHWFSSNSILYGGDVSFPFDIKNSVNWYYYLWTSNIFPGFPAIAWSWLPYWLFIELIHLITGKLSSTQELLYVLLLASAIYNYFLLSIHFFKSVFSKEATTLMVVTAVIFSFIYIFNLYTFFYAFSAFNPMAFILAFLPLNILAFWNIYPINSEQKTYSVRKWLFVFLISLFLMSPGFTGYIFLFEYYAILIILLISNLVVKKFNKHIIVESVVFLLLVFFFNYWWLLPLQPEISNSYSSQASIGTSIYFVINAKYSQLLNIFRLMGNPVMGNNPYSWSAFYENNIIVKFIFILPFLFIYVLLNTGRLANKLIINIIIAIVLISIFLIKLNNPPLAFVTKIMFDYIPFFGAFRDAYHKAGLYFIFFYLLIGGTGFVLLIKDLNKFRIWKILAFLLLILSVIGVTGPYYLFSYDNIAHSKLLYRAKNYEITTKISVPQEYYELKSNMENKCAGTAVMVVPRSSILTIGKISGQQAYAGQDILSRLINCNFLSSLLLSNQPDAYVNSLYLMIQNNDTDTLKKALIRNNIGYVLARKDLIPAYTTTQYYSPIEQFMKDINTDESYQITYQNKLFILYALKELRDSHSYGFSMASGLTFTNLDLQSPRDYYIIQKELENSDSNILVTPHTDNINTADINKYIAVGNCIGCNKINQDSIVMKPDPAVNPSIKKFIKNVFPTKAVALPQDQQISKLIIDNNNIFLDFINNINLHNRILLDSKKDEYLNGIKIIFNKLSSLDKRNFFDKNQKYIEYNNFLTAQRNFTLKLLLDRKLFGLQTVQKVLNEQNNILDNIAASIWQTDFTKNIYLNRLDIPVSGPYICGTYPINKDITITDYLFGFDKKKTTLLTGSEYSLHAGSYPVEIHYNSVKYTDVVNIIVPEKNIKEIKLNNLVNGRYVLTINASGDNKDLRVFISRNRIALKNNLTSFIKNIYNNPDIVFDDVLDINKYVFDKYQNSFSLNQYDYKNTSLYLYVMPNQPAGKTHDYIINSITVEKQIEDGDIAFVCSYTKNKTITDNKISVLKNNPTDYVVKINKGQNKYLSFNQAYHSSWAAAENKTLSFFHFKSGYANAWEINAMQSDKLEVAFTRQKTYILLAILDIIIFIFMLVIYNKIRNGK